MTRLHRRGAAALLALALTVASVLFAQSASAYPPHHHPTLTLSSNTEPQGGTDTAFGAHFTPNSNVTLTLHSAKVVVGHATTDGSGSFTTNFTVPRNFPTGQHTVTAVDSKHKHASAALRVTGRHHAGGVHVSNPNPPEGGSITVSGTSCTPGATITVSLDGTNQLGQTTADSSGAYSITVTLPDGVTGHHQIVVSGGGCDGVEGINIQSGGGLVNTGVAVASIGGLGVLLLAAGGFALLAGRRRNTAV